MANIFTISDADFDLEVLHSNIPVLVDFWAPWCGPCKMVAPTVEAMAEEYDGRLKVCKLNVDDNPATASTYGIMGIPTVAVFKDGKVVQKIVGALPRETMKRKVEAAL